MIVLQVRSIEANRSLAPIMGGLVKIKDSGETVDIGGRQSVMVSLFPDPDCEKIVLFGPDCVFLFRLQWAQFRLKYCFPPLLLLLFLSTLNKKGNLLAVPPLPDPSPNLQLLTFWGGNLMALASEWYLESWLKRLKFEVEVDLKNDSKLCIVSIFFKPFFCLTTLCHRLSLLLRSFWFQQISFSLVRSSHHLNQGQLATCTLT